MNLYRRLENALRGAAGRLALRCPESQAESQNSSYGQLFAAAERMAGALRALGVGASDRVVAQVEKTPEAVSLYLGCLKLGAVYVPLNTAYTKSEVEYFLTDAASSVFVADSRLAASAPPDVRVETLDAGGGSLAALASGVDPLAETTAREDGDVAAIIYTSGTTGRAKGAMLTHGNLASNAQALNACWGWRPDDVLLHALPIFHVHGLFVALHCAFLAGSPTIFLSRFDAQSVLDALPQATVMMGVPTFYTRLLSEDAFTATLCRHMRLFISGSAPLAEQTFHAFEQRTGHRILERYGMSETLMNTSNPLDGERIAGTVGFALPGVEARIADAAGTPVAAGEVGGIEVRGRNVFSGYWRMPEKTRSEFRADGFFITGDVGVMDADGRVAIVGRAKDVVISGGYNIYPKEVEALLDEMPGVRESAVIGVPHPDFGEAVVAVLVAEQDVAQEDVDTFLRGRLARFKHPKRVVRVARLPRNVMGKVQKNALREAHRGLFGETAGAVAEQVKAG